MSQKSPELEAMWVEYKQTGEVVLRNKLVEAYLPVVDYLAERIGERLPRSVSIDDVRSAGVIGLLDAVERFDLARNIKFETFCSLRIRGSILDELRSIDWVPRLVRSKAQKFILAVRKLEAELGHAATAHEIITRLKITPTEYEDTLKDVELLKIYSLTEVTGAHGEGDSIGIRLNSLTKRDDLDPIFETEKHEIVQLTREELDDKEREVFNLHYFEGLPFKEIGRLLHLSESRICQIHGEAIIRIREKLSNEPEDAQLQIVQRLPRPL
jgi:RNA polymerase sigma factor for flagellar operon FliA